MGGESPLRLRGRLERGLRTQQTPTPMSTNQQVATRNDLKQLLDGRYKGRLQAILNERAPQFAAALVQVVNRSYQLQKCKPETVIGAAITAAALDLSFDPNLGEAHLVPYGEVCTFQIGYRGLTALAQRTGQYKRMGWMVVYEGQLKSWNPLTGELVIDQAAKTGPRVIGYAAYFQLLSGFERGEYWTEEEILEHAARFSQAYKKDKKDSPWFTSKEKMALKTVWMALIRPWGPKTPTLAKAMAMDGTTRKGPDGEPENVFDIDSTVTDPGKETEPTTSTQESAPSVESKTQKETSTKEPTQQTHTPPATGRTPQFDLMTMVDGWGHSFATFITWAGKEGGLQNADSYPSWDDVPTDFCRRMLRAVVGLKRGLDETAGVLKEAA